MKIKVVSLIAFLSVFGIVIPVTAQEAVAPLSTPAQQPEESETRAQRLESIKQARTENLNTTQLARIKTRCKSAQAKTATVQARMDVVFSNRQLVYTKITTQVSELVAKLQQAGITTTTLEATQKDMLSELDTLISAFEEHKTTLGDIAEMDCEVDPNLFQAALLTARDQKSAIRTQAAAFRDFVSTNLKTELQNVRAQYPETTSTKVTPKTEGEQ